MCEYCDMRKKPLSLLSGDIVDVYLVNSNGESKFESKGLLIERARSWLKSEPYADFLCPKSVIRRHQKLGKEDGVFVMAIKEKWLVKLLDLPNQPTLPRWIPKYHSTGIVHVPDALDEDLYTIDICLIDGEKYRVDYSGFCKTEVMLQDSSIILTNGNYVSFNSLISLPQNSYDILQATCSTLGKTFKRGDYVSYEGGVMVIQSMRYKNGVISAFGKNGRNIKANLCDLDHTFEAEDTINYDIDLI